MTSLNKFLNKVNTCIYNENGNELRDLLQLNNAAAQQAVFEGKRGNARWDPEHLCTQKLHAQWDSFIACHLLSVSALQEGQRTDAYAYATSGVQDFIKLFREDKEAWLVGPMQGVARNLKALAQAADEQLKGQGKPANKLEDCTNQLRSCFSVCMQGAGNREKKKAALEIVNVSFKILFRINSLHLCKTLVRPVDSPAFPAFHTFPASQRVTYKYYRGRLHVFNEEYTEAAETLQYALQQCHPGAVSNVRRILLYLVPVKMLLGVMPSRKLLEQYKLRQYDGLIAALRCGSIQSFDAALLANQYNFIQAGTYLLLEKLRNSVYRRLLKRVALIWAQHNPAKASQVQISWFQRALEWQGEQPDYAEVECIVANLIYRKYIKGYISLQHRVVVLSKADPFPPLDQATITE